jgi:beta-galactosidase
MPLKAHQICVALDASASSCRSRGKPFWIGELQTGDGVTGMRFGAQVTAGDVDRWAWQCVSRGATGLHYYAWYPMSCGYEVSGFGLCEPDGSVNERVTSAGNVSKIIRRNKDLFLEAKPIEAKIGILYNVKAHGTLPGLRVQGAEILRKDMFGFYRAMMEQGFPVDVLHLDDLYAERLQHYKTLFIPGSFVLNQRIADTLKVFVRDGGTLIADFRPGWIDEEGNLSHKIPGMGLDEVFGCYEDYTIENRDTLTWCTDAYENIPAHDHITTFILTTGKAFGYYQKHPVCVKNPYGKGYGIIVGTQIGCVIEESNRADIKHLLCSIAMEAGSKPTVTWVSSETGGTTEDIEVRMNIGNKGTILFLFNYGVLPNTIDIRLENGRFSGQERVCDLKTGEALCFQETGNGYGLRATLLPEETRILSITTKEK